MKYGECKQVNYIQVGDLVEVVFAPDQSGWMRQYLGKIGVVLELETQTTCRVLLQESGECSPDMSFHCLDLKVLAR